MRSDGSGRRALAPNPSGPDGGARWSPDGTHVAFWSERAVAGRLVRGLYLMRADGHGPAPAHAAQARSPKRLRAADWSPDGASIAFSAEKGSRRGIWAIRSDGTRLRFLASGGFGPLWSPRGDRIAFSDGSRIEVVPAAGGAVRRLTRGPNDTSPAWSPDGRTIAFVRSDANGDRSRSSSRPPGGRSRRLFGGTRDVTMAETPNGRPRGGHPVGGEGGVYVVRVGHRRARRLRRRGDWPTWSPTVGESRSPPARRSTS